MTVPKKETKWDDGKAEDLCRFCEECTDSCDTCTNTICEYSPRSEV